MAQVSFDHQSLRTTPSISNTPSVKPRCAACFYLVLENRCILPSGRLKLFHVSHSNMTMNQQQFQDHHNKIMSFSPNA